MKLRSTIRFIRPEHKDAYFRLELGDASERELFRAIGFAFDNIEQNVFSGIQIPKNLIPKEYRKKYGIRNLWKYNLPNRWRLLYSITSEDVLVISVILEWLVHKDYENKFNY